MEEKFDKILSKHLQSEYGWGYAVSVELDAKPLFKHYSGVVEHDGFCYPVDENRAFDVGSIAKQFAACCIAILACEKRINLDDSVRVYLPEMKEYANKITIRHALSMTSGVRNIYGLKYFQSFSPLSEMELFYRQEQPMNDVGNFQGYSNQCYTLLGQIVEKLTGNTPEFAKQRIFEPLGMTNTKGYGDMGDGGLTSTAEDLVKWHNCLMNRSLPSAPDGLFDVIYSPSYFNNGELCPYGFGFFYDDNDRDIIWQYGDMTDWQSVIRVDLKKKLSIIVLTHFKNNPCEPVEIALDLENAIIGELFNLPKHSNYKTAYYNRPHHAGKTRQVEHLKSPNAQKQSPVSEINYDKYLGRYYSNELDTYFDIIPDGSRFQMKYADKDAGGYINLLDFSDENNLKAHTCGDWGIMWFPIEFYGNRHKIDFFALQWGVGHFYFIKQN